MKYVIHTRLVANKCNLPGLRQISGSWVVDILIYFHLFSGPLLLIDQCCVTSAVDIHKAGKMCKNIHDNQTATLLEQNLVELLL